MIVFVRATPAHQAGMMEVVAAAFDARFGEGWNAGQITSALAASDRVGEVAIEDTRIIGFSLARYAAKEAELLLVAVLPECRRRGVAAMLISRAISEVGRRGADAIFLEVRDANHAASALYRAQGFAPVGRRRAYYAGKDQRRYDAITMRRCLNFASNMDVAI